MEPISTIVERVQDMLDTLKRDWREAWDTTKNPSRIVGHVNLPDYRKKFGLDDELGKKAIHEYCESLPKIQPQYLVCPICNKEWDSLEKIARPINNGHIIDWVDSFTMWCCDDSHDSLTYYQNKDGTISFDMEIDGFENEYYQVRWNCECMVEDCSGKCVLIKSGDDYHPYEILKEFNPPLPINLSKEEVRRIIIGNQNV